MAEHRDQAVLAVIADGLSIKQVAEKVGVSRQSLDGLSSADVRFRRRWAPMTSEATDQPRQS